VICPPDANGTDLLARSVLVGRQRYATDGERAYCAQQHEEARNAWHGYPVSWDEVPPRLIAEWVAQGIVDRRTVRRARKRAR
jgi:hypothetical protein